MTDGTANAVNLGLLNEVTVVIVTFNSAHCLPELGRQLSTCPHVIVVDNGSDDGCAQVALTHLPQAQVIALPTNLGFGAANNRALAKVETPFSLLLNPDCELSSAKLVQLLAAADQFPEAAMLAPQLLDTKGQPEANYRWPSTLWTSKGPVATGPTSVGFVCGAAMLLRMSVCQPTGFFDETFFLYYEDDDLCLRFFKAGLSMVVVPSVQAVHRSRGSVKGRAPYKAEYLRGFHHAQSKLLFAAKHSSPHSAQRLRLHLVWQTAVVLPLRVLFFSPKLIARMWGRLRGALDSTLLADI
jgi:N-acetylglucosaminyl-diphospho-decaprenol L-rhamnosyltransferase